MALNTQLTNTAANTQLDALSLLADAGYLRIYNGTQPATGDTPVTTQTLLAELRLNNTAFAAAVDGVITANAISDDESAAETGTATWFRILMTDGTTKLWDGSVGTSNANLVLNSVNIQQGARVRVLSFTHTLPKSGS